MKQRRRIYYSKEQCDLMWERYEKGWSLSAIARLFERNSSSVHTVLYYSLFQHILHQSLKDMVFHLYQLHDNNRIK